MQRQNTCEHMIYLFQNLGALKRTMENIKDPLFRFFEREVNAGSRLLTDVRQDLTDIMLVCRAEKKPTNHHRSMMADLIKGKICTAELM